MLAAARGALADFLGGDPAEIAFGANMTTLTFHLAPRPRRGGWAPGDEIVVTELDHHANVDPWRALARERGVVVQARAASAPRRAQLDWTTSPARSGRRRGSSRSARPRTRSARSTTCARAADLAHAAGALVFVDAVHYAPHALVDVAALGCDFLACSAYKFYGPHVGVLWGRQRAARGARRARSCEPAPENAPGPARDGHAEPRGHRRRGRRRRLPRLAGRGPRPPRAPRARRSRRSTSAGQRSWSGCGAGLRAIDGVTLYGPPPGEPRTPTVAFTVHGPDLGGRRARARRPRRLRLARRLLRHDGRRAGSATRTDGLVRAGCACYTTADEVDRLVEGVAELAR